MKQFLFGLVTLLLVSAVPIVSFGSDDTPTAKVSVEDVIFSNDLDHVDVITFEITSDISGPVLVNDIGKHPVSIAVDADVWEYSYNTALDYDNDKDVGIHGKLIQAPIPPDIIHAKDYFTYLENKSTYDYAINAPDKQSRTNYWSTHEGKSSGVLKTLYGSPLIE